MSPDNLPPQRAVALTYRSGDNAPKIAAKGYGPIAEEIIRRARDAGVYVHESRELVQLLMQVDMDAHIPPNLYQVIAVLLGWVYRLEKNLANPSEVQFDTIGSTKIQDLI
jgi:flagellar biosynthesis protein